MTDARYAMLTGEMEIGLERVVSAAIADAKDEAKAKVGFLGGLVFPAVWTVVVALATPLARIALRWLLAYLSHMTLGDVADFLSLTRSRQAAMEGRSDPDA